MKRLIVLFVFIGCSMSGVAIEPDIQSVHQAAHNLRQASGLTRVERTEEFTGAKVYWVRDNSTIPPRRTTVVDFGGPLVSTNVNCGIDDTSFPEIAAWYLEYREVLTVEEFLCFFEAAFSCTENSLFVIDDHSDIPCSLDASDVYRDLKLKGLGDDEICEKLTGAVRGKIANTTIAGEVVYFQTWSYFGGSVLGWELDLENGVLSPRPIGLGIGSYDYYY